MSKTRVSETKLDLIRVSDVKPESVEWLFPGCIPKNKVSMIVGHPGQGKSTLTAEIAAIVTAGRRWPISETQAKVGNVLILSSEDDVADTMAPRLLAAGADTSKVHVIRGVIEKDKTRAFSLIDDIGRLEDSDADLLIIDPISSYLPKVDSHNNAEVRSLMEFLVQFVDRTGITTLCVSHLNKAENIDPLSRVSGSMAFVAVPRAVHILVPDPDDLDRRILFPLKNNLGRDQEGLAFSIQSRVIEGGIQTSGIDWESEYVSPPDTWTSSRKPKSKVQQASDFIVGLLSEKPYPAIEVLELADRAGHSKASIRRAKETLRINVQKSGMQGGWIWSLPNSKLEGAQDGQDHDASLMRPFADDGDLQGVNNGGRCDE